MAKSIGLIGNFKGKVGNMVGYKNSASNTANTQGIRVYQPIVKNPKTAAQAEQRAKMAPINATYRALKMIIDRGNEGLPYGNKSRLAWLKQAFQAEHMPWIEKGKVVIFPIGCMLTKGSLPGIDGVIVDGSYSIECQGVDEETPVGTVGALSTLLIGEYSFLKPGDQVTFVIVGNRNNTLVTMVQSVVIDTESTEVINFIKGNSDDLIIETSFTQLAGCCIVSREGEFGEHLRSNASLNIPMPTYTAAPYDATSKTAAIGSYMSSAAVNSDWAEESIQ